MRKLKTIEECIERAIINEDECVELQAVNAKKRKVEQLNLIEEEEVCDKIEVKRKRNGGLQD